MTREETKNIVRHVFHFYEVSVENYNWADMNEACIEILKALEQEPCEELEFIQPHKKVSVNLEVCTDAISREQAASEYADWYGYNYANNFFYKRLRSMPSVTPQPKMGRWIEERNDYGEIEHWHCSNCYDDSGFITTCKWDYCPHCGAKMESED